MRVGKWCSNCKEYKEANLFYNDLNRKGGLYYCCKTCVSKRAANYRQQNPKANAWAQRRSKYGVSEKQWNELFSRQEKVCAICKSSNPNNKRGWQTDHNHETGQIRGILCYHCNMIVRKHATIEILVAAINYLKSISSITLILLFLNTPALAYRCPYGQIYRVHLDQCVDIHSKLAVAYVSRPVHISLRKLIIDAAPVAPAIVKPDDLYIQGTSILYPVPNKDTGIDGPPYPRWVIDKLNEELEKLHQ